MEFAIEQKREGDNSEIEEMERNQWEKKEKWMIAVNRTSRKGEMRKSQKRRILRSPKTAG